MKIENTNFETLKSPTALRQSNFFQQILKVNAEPVTLGYLFDNIRNYTLATTVVIAGLWLLSTSESILGIPYLNLIFGFHVVVCGLFLIGLNFAHSILRVKKILGHPWLDYIIYLTLLTGSLEIIWVSFWKFFN